MKVELEIIDLGSMHKALDRKSYENEGLYVVNDGITFYIVNVQEDMVSSMPITNKDILKVYESEKYLKAQQDFFGIIDSRLDFIINKLMETRNNTSNLSELVDIIKAVNEPFIGKNNA